MHLKTPKLDFVLKQIRTGADFSVVRGPWSRAQCGLFALACKRNILYPRTIMDDTKTPATKADIRRLGGRMDKLRGDVDVVKGQLKTLEGKTERLDKRFDNLERRLDKRFDHLDEYIDRILDILVREQNRVDDHDKRLTKLEVTVGIA